MEKELQTVTDIFKALGDASRLKILKLIKAKGNNLCVGMIARELEISQPAVSQHLKILKNNNIVEGDKQGFHVHYTVKGDSLRLPGIDLDAILDALPEEFKHEENCELKEDQTECASLNN